ncbi:MAG: alpha-isopropylmalate synthase regulatory domain-containing protein [Flavobacteriaceae bacterium]
MSQQWVEIMDTTLRDGEQTSGVSFSTSEKLTLAQLLLEELQVDRIEVASARVSDGELASVQAITEWGMATDKIDQIEILTFLDEGSSLTWMEKAGARVQNILTKGSLNHLKHQLKQTPEIHFKRLENCLREADSLGIQSNIYLEDWSNGMRHSSAYVWDYLAFLNEQKFKRLLLPDTLGILTPAETFDYISSIREKYPAMHIDFHGHNDYDIGVANTMEAIRANVSGIHLTVNGMGERAGNVPLASIVAVINDFFPDKKINIREENLYRVSQLVATFSGFRIPVNKPVVGENVFTQTAGIHADGDNKHNLYYNDLLPERFGRKRKYALGKTSGKANIQKNLQELGLQLNEENLKKVTQRIIELGDKKEQVTAEDLPFIISDVLNTKQEAKVNIKSFVLTHAKGMQPSTNLRVEIEGKSYEAIASGDGQYDAFIKALNTIYSSIGKPLPQLTDYAVHIPPNSHSDALCETTIRWRLHDKEFTTRGLDSDQTVSAIKATEKMLNIISQ